MKNKILEISKRALKKAGRVPIKIALLEIQDNEKDTNKNGLHWNETFVTNAMDSAIMMPICASFCDETKSTPLDHGLTGYVENENGVAEPVFENSETVGVIESVSIETIKNDEDNDIKVLVGIGYLYNQRYPNFVKWVRKNYALGKVDTSIEIMGTPENDNNIIYLEEEPSEEFRTPKEFAFSGTAILSLPPADENATVLEVAQKHIKEDEQDMEFNMDEVKSVIQSTITELNNKEIELTTKISELNQELSQKDLVITEKEEKIVELNATVEQVQRALDDLQKEHDVYWKEREILETELAKLKAEARIGELNSAIEKFSDEEKKYAEVEINSFNENPMDGNVESIVSKIYAGIGEASKKASEKARIAEINTKNEPTVEDIFSEICSEAYMNSEEEDLDIFN